MKRTILILGMISLGLLAACDSLKSKELSPEKKLELAEKCSTTGKAYFNDYIRDLRDLSKGYLWDEPEYHYSSHLNTCLIHIRYIKLDLKSSSQRNQVIDIFSNKPILYGWIERDVEKNTETLTDSPNGDVPNYTSIEYFKRKDKLFAE